MSSKDRKSWLLNGPKLEKRSDGDLNVADINFRNMPNRELVKLNITLD